MVPLGEVMIPAGEPHRVETERSYPNLGIYSFARGCFGKPPIDGNLTSAPTLYRVRSGQFIYSRLFAFEGAYAVVPDELDGAFVSNEFPCFAVQRDRVLPRYLRWMFSLPRVWAALAEGSKGMGDRRKRVHPEQLLAYQAALPPLDDQRRIVERLDAVEARSRELAALRTVIAHDLGLLRQRAIAGILNQIETKPLPLSSLLREPPRNGHSTRPDGESSGVPMLRISAATSRDDGVVDLTDFRRTVLQPQEVVRLGLVADDLLACRFNGNAHFTGRFAIVRKTPSEPTIYPDKLIRFRVDRARVDPRYVQILMNNGACRSAVEALCQTTAGNIGLSASKLAEVSLPVPPLPDQHAVVERVQAVETQVRQALISGAEAASELDQLLPALLTEAFGSG